MSSFMNKTLLPKAANISPNPSTSSSSSTNGGISNTTNNNNNDYRRPSQIESYGVHCQEPTCNLSDFLPFKCEFCKKSYCSSHRIPNSTHDCPSYDASKYDIKVDTCQWCNEPLKVEHLTNGRESDINIIMEDHINSGHCKVLQNVGKDGLLQDRSGKTVYSSLSTANGNKKKKNNEKKCNYARCKNTMWVEMKCPQCRISFCPTHRETRSHKCGENMQVDTNSTQGNKNKSSSKINTSPTTTPSAPSMMKSRLSSTGTATSSTTKTSTKISPLAAPANPFSRLSLPSSSKNSSSSSTSTKVSTAALSKTSPTSTSPEYAISSSSNNNSNSNNNNNKAVGAATPVTLPNVINVIKSKTTSNVSEMSTSRRAAKEREQAALALQNRARKGLLSEDEKIRYATLQAVEAQRGSSSSSKTKDNKDCCIS